MHKRGHKVSWRVEGICQGGKISTPLAQPLRSGPIRRIGTDTIRLTALSVRYLNQIVELDHEFIYTMVYNLAIY